MSAASNRPAASGMVDILILNWNGWRDTIECLESVYQLRYPKMRAVVCDNGSTDDSLARIRAWAAARERAEIRSSPLPSPYRADVSPVSLVEYDAATAVKGGDARADDAQLVLIRIGDNRGFAGGNNVGLEFTIASGRAQYVWLLNNDMVVDPDSLDRMVLLAEADRNLGSVGATLLEYSMPNVVQAAGGGRLVAWQGMPRPHSASGKRRGSAEARHPDRLDFITMGCMLAPVEVLKTVGLIDTRYFIYCEDIDYSLRVLAAGLRIGFAPDAEVWHKGSASMVPGSAKHDYNMVRSSLLLVSKFNRRLMPLAFLHSLVRCAAPKIVRRQPERLRAVLRAYRDVARGPQAPATNGARNEPAGSRS